MPTNHTLRPMPGRHCVCGTRQVQPPRTARATAIAERCAELGLPVDIRLSAVRDPELLRLLGAMSEWHLCRVCGWPKIGRQMNTAAAR